MGKTVAFHLDTEKELKVYDMLFDLSTCEHPRNPFKGQSVDDIAKNLVVKEAPYEHWIGVGSTRRPGGK